MDQEEIEKHIGTFVSKMNKTRLLLVKINLPFEYLRMCSFINNVGGKQHKTNLKSVVIIVLNKFESHTKKGL